MKGLYINLSNRTDRNNHMQKLKKQYKFFKDIDRFDAIYHKKYGIGCSLSHINCLKLLLEFNEDFYLIMEDDFFIFNNKVFLEFLEEFEKIKNNNNWDVITLTPRGDTQQKNYINNFHKVMNNQTATAYIIKHNFINTLLPLLIDGNKQLLNGGDPNLFCLDQCWKPLQKNSNWIYYHIPFAGQLPNYSDIEKKYTDYNKRFLEQIYY